MVKPAWLFDGRVMLEQAALHKIGFNVHSIGIKGKGQGAQANGNSH